MEINGLRHKSNYSTCCNLYQTGLSYLIKDELLGNFLNATKTMLNKILLSASEG